MNTNLQNYGIFLKKNICLSLKSNIVLSIILLLAIPIVRSVGNLTVVLSAECLELFVSLIGITMIIPITKNEHNTEIREIIFGKKISYILTVITRLIFAFIIVFLMIVIYAIIMQKLNSEFPFWSFVIATTFLAYFWGLLGLLMSEISRNSIVGYLSAFGYYSLISFGFLTSSNFMYLLPITDGSLSMPIFIKLVIVNIVMLFIILLIAKKEKI